VHFVEPDTGAIHSEALKRAVVQIAGSSEKRCIHHCIIMLKGLTSKQQAQRYL
jgi:hypothetical protein